MPAQHVTFEAEGLSLEGRLHLPEGEGSWPGVVVSHPHPLYGGDMYNNVVQVVCAALQRRGIASLAFNFRGVGGSEGSHGSGEGEQMDAIAALDFLRAWDRISHSKVGLAGYSFGAGVAANVAACYPDLGALALISGGARREQAVRLPAVPKLMVIGTLDNLAAGEGLRQAVEAMQEPRQLVLVPGADHFWMKGEEELERIVGAFFAGALSEPALSR